jgi:hypothetical protein
MNMDTLATIVIVLVIPQTVRRSHFVMQLPGNVWLDVKKVKRERRVMVGGSRVL